MFDWKPEHDTVLRVLALDGSGLVRRFQMPPWFSYHFINSFETTDADLGRCICVDVPVAENANSISELYLDNMRDRGGNISRINIRCTPAALALLAAPHRPRSHPRLGRHAPRRLLGAVSTSGTALYSTQHVHVLMWAEARPGCSPGGL